MNTLTYKLPDDFAKAVAATIEDWKKNDKVKRLWAKDASLWTNTDENKWLGWLTIVAEQIAQHAKLKKIAAEIEKAGFTHCVLLGMGGSSLCVEVFEKTYGKEPGRPRWMSWIWPTRGRFVPSEK